MNCSHFFIDEFKNIPVLEKLWAENEGLMKRRTGFLIFPLCEMDLKTRISHGESITELVFLKYLQDLLLGIVELKKKKIVHRGTFRDFFFVLFSPFTFFQDLKPDNVLVSDRDHLLITDFETQLILPDFKMCCDFTSGFCKGGSTFYLPPEIMKAKEGEVLNYSKSDIFSVGLIAYKMVSSNDPFNKKDPKDRTIDDFVSLNSNIVSQEMELIIRDMIHPEISQRLDCERALEIVSRLLKVKTDEEIEKQRREFMKIGDN